MSAYAERGEPLPVPGGYDEAGHLSTDPAAIERTQRALPIGYWKGSALALLLDVFAAGLSGGLLTSEIAADAARETGVSQIFLAIAPHNDAMLAEMDAIASRAVDALHAAPALDGTKPVRYPGEQVLRLREDSMKNGVLIEDAVYARFLALEAEA